MLATTDHLFSHTLTTAHLVLPTIQAGYHGILRTTDYTSATRRMHRGMTAITNPMRVASSSYGVTVSYNNILTYLLHGAESFLRS